MYLLDWIYPGIISYAHLLQLFIVMRFLKLQLYWLVVEVSPQLIIHWLQLGDFSTSLSLTLSRARAFWRICVGFSLARGWSSTDPSYFVAPLPSVFLVLELFLVLVVLEEFGVMFCTCWEDGVGVFLILLPNFPFFLEIWFFFPSGIWFVGEWCFASNAYFSCPGEFFQHYPLWINIYIKPLARQEVGCPSQIGIQFPSLIANAGLGLGLGRGLGPVGSPIPRVHVRVVVIFVDAKKEVRSSSSCTPSSDSFHRHLRGHHSCCSYCSYRPATAAASAERPSPPPLPPPWIEWQRRWIVAACEKLK